ncbi:hypothetical protein VNO78_09083 [Psophocarpus tetragonolobus]|uniref:Peptidase metallopeptidase domain-containing protein n=1 Tax=Psophocarpus tetragonolobus TaxID=3891 RepID=A0AAN9SW17_PSOTE
MKAYICAFLLFLFILDKPVSARVPPSSTTKRKFPPPKPNTPPKQITGLSIIKKYFSNFGYLQSDGPFNDNVDEETISAFKTYQQYFNLQVTGYLNDETFQLISLPRCGIPDMNFNYEFIDNFSWPKEGNQWFTKTNLTYGFVPASEISLNMMQVLRRAFTRWAQAVGVVSLTETTYEDADINVGFYNFGNNVWDEVLGRSFIRLEPSHNVTTGEIQLDATEIWGLPSESDSVLWGDGVLDLESAAVHQIGHLLGLDHSNEEDSVMYPYVLPSHPRKVELSHSDMVNIQKPYTNGISGQGGRWGVLLVIATFSLAFPYLFFY